MPKRSLRSLLTAVALLPLPLASSALLLPPTSSARGAHASHSERTRANHRHGRRGARHAPGHGFALVRKAATTTTTSTALLGDEAMESNRDSLSAGQAEAFPFQARTAGATGAVYVYVDSPNAAKTVIVGLYANLNGHPGSLLTTGSLSSPLPGAWDTVPVASTQLVSGTTYWLAVLGTGGTLRYRDRPHGPCKAETSSQTNLGALNAQWRTGTLYSTCPVSAYVSAAAATLPVGPLKPVEPVPTPEPTPPVVPTPTPPVVPTPTPPVTTTPTPPVETPPPPPSAPTASFTYSPTSPTTSQAVTLNGTSSTCPDGPCTYEWSDDGGPTRPIPALWPLGSGQTLQFTFSGAGTKYVRLVATDALGRTATVEHNVVVEATPPPPPPPPPALLNTAPPAIKGVAIEGETLSVTKGTWSVEPTSRSYQWQDCNTAGEDCTNIAGASTSTYKLGAGDVGHTVTVSETAGANSETATATSAHTPVVEAKEQKSGTPTDCFGREEACGYPGPNDTGVEAGVTLTPHAGSVVISTAGTTVKDERIEGNLEIAANNVTVENVEVIAYSQKRVCEKTGGAEGSGGLEVREHGNEELSTGILIQHVTVHGVTQGCPESLGEGITMRESSSAANVKVQWSKVYWTRMCFFQSAAWENNYCNDNGAIPGAHYDGIYDNGEGTPGAKPGLILKHNTILMPHWQTAPLFLSNEQEVGEEHIEDNLLAGGGYLMYLPGADTPTVKGPITVTGNRLARCTGKETGSKTGGHHLCEGLTEENETTSTPLTPSTLGYFPKGGSYGALYPSYNTTTDHLSGDYWDNNLEAAP
jgi:hypothetical protein